MEILSQAGNYVGPVINVGVVIGLVCWLSRSKVDNKACDRTHNAVNTEHQNIRKYISDAEQRAENRHSELVKLIKNNGKPKSQRAGSQGTQ